MQAPIIHLAICHPVGCMPELDGEFLLLKAHGTSSPRHGESILSLKWKFSLLLVHQSDNRYYLGCWLRTVTNCHQSFTENANVPARNPSHSSGSLSYTGSIVSLISGWHLIWGKSLAALITLGKIIQQVERAQDIH